MDIQQLRRDNLQTLTEQHGGVVALASRIERDPSQISRWLAWPAAGSRSISNQLAAHIEQQLKLPARWLSTLHHPTTDPQHPLLDAACQYLSTSPDPAITAILENLLRAITPRRDL